MNYAYTEKQIQANELRKKGKTYAAIAKEMGISLSGAREHFVHYKRKERYNAIIQDFQKGESVETIVQKYGYPLSTIQSLVRDIASNHTSKAVEETKYAYTEKQIQVNELRKKGETFTAIAKEMGITPSVARGHFVSYKRKERHNTIIQEFRSGISVETIAQKYGYPISTIQSIVRDA